MYLKNKLNKFFLNKVESQFIRKNQTFQNSIIKSKGFFVARDYRFLVLFKKISQYNTSSVVLFVPTLYHPKLFDIITVIPYLSRTLYNYFVEKKWIRLYSSLSEKVIIIKPKLSVFNRIKVLIDAFNYWKNINKKDQIICLTHKGIQIGELIYDTYIRFYNSPEVKPSSFNLLFLIYTAIKNIEFYKDLELNIKSFEYYTPYTSYIASGTISKGLLINKNHDIEIYTCAFPEKIKKISLKHFTHSPDFSLYRVNFSALDNKNLKLEKAKNLFESRFSGNLDLSYMRVNVFEENEIVLNYDFDGILFLHDFMDAPHDYGNLLFNDFYEWANETLEFIKLNNLKIGVKPHPNQTKESKKVCDKLIKSHQDIKWINPKLNNNVIFKSNIKFGVSVFGTVLSELAFFNKIPIAAGANPFVAYNFVLNPQTKKEYFNYLLDQPTHEINRNEIYEFYYMNYLHNESDINYIPKTFLKRLKNENIDIKDFINENSA